MAAVEEQTILSIDVIRTDGGTQPRAEVDQEVIRDYAQQMFEGVQFPPVTVYYDGTDYWLADGFHRYYAAKQQCKDILYADVRQGTRRDAVLFSVGANATHGLRRTNNDKRKAVETLLNDPEWAKWSNREIARRCAVDETSVRRYRENVTAALPQLEDRTYITKHGTIATMNTAKIGQQPSLSEHEASLAGYRGYDKWQEAQKWEDKRRELEPDTEPEIPAYTPPRYEAPTWAPTIPSPAPTPAPMPASLYSTYTEEDEDEEQEETKEERDHFMPLMSSSETPEWYTPLSIIERVQSFFGEIDLDPCSNSHEAPNVPARTLYTKDDDGLAQPWHGSTYMNPPYGGEISKWVKKLLDEYESGNVKEAIALVPGRIDTAWFQPLYEHLICAIKGRVQFIGASTNSAPFPSVAVYLGPRKEDFIQTFKDMGPIVTRIA